MKLFLIIGFCTLLSIVSSAFDCPKANDVVFPCECFPDGSLLCSDYGRRPKIDQPTLARAFKTLAKSHRHYPSVLISETSIDKIRPTTFGDIAFNKIKLEQNFNLSLSSIDRRSLVASKSTLVEFSSINIGANENMLWRDSHAWTVFEAFDDFDKLQQLTIAYHRLPTLPRSIFGRAELPSLRRLFLNDNGLETVGDFAFYRLPNLSWLNLNFNQIRTLTNMTFAFEKPSNKTLRIELWFNRLNEFSFEDNTFVNVQRPLELELFHNNIGSISEHVFRPLLEAHPTSWVSFKGNQIACDCEARWILEADHLTKDRIRDVLCQNGKPLFDLTVDDLDCRLSGAFGAKYLAKNRIHRQAVDEDEGRVSIELDNNGHQVKNGSSSKRNKFGFIWTLGPLVIFGLYYIRLINSFT